MSTHHGSPTPTSGPLHALVENLLDCGGVLSQIISSMIEWDATHPPDPDAVPIPKTAHALIRDVVDQPLRHRYSKRDLAVAARIVADVTQAMAEDIFQVDPNWLEAALDGADDPEGPPGANACMN